MLKDTLLLLSTLTFSQQSILLPDYTLKHSRNKQYCNLVHLPNSHSQQPILVLVVE